MLCERDTPATPAGSASARGTAATDQPSVSGTALIGQARPRNSTLESRDGQVFVVDHSTYGTFVNDERVGGRLQLKVGDVLRLGAPGVSLELIRVLPDHGAS